MLKDLFAFRSPVALLRLGASLKKIYKLALCPFLMVKETYIDDISVYIRKNLKKGYTKESLKWALVQQGYSKIEVEKGLRRVDQELAASAPVLAAKPTVVVQDQQIPASEEKKSFWKKLFG